MRMPFKSQKLSKRGMPDPVIIKYNPDGSVKNRYRLLSGPWEYEGKENFKMDQLIANLESSGIKCETRNFKNGIYVYRSASGWKE